MSALLAVHCILPVELQAAPPTEQDIKYAYLYNFTKFVTWPAEAFDASQNMLHLCVAGTPPPQDTVNILNSKSTEGRSLRVRLLDDGENLSGCHIAFFTGSSATLIDRRLNDSSGFPVLTVSDHSGFASERGMIEFVLDRDDRMRIMVNLSNAKQQNITISAKLLETALKIYRNE